MNKDVEEKDIGLETIRKQKKEAFDHAVEAFKIHIAHHPEAAKDVQTVSPLFERFFKAMEMVVAWRHAYTKFGPDTKPTKVTKRGY